MTANKASLELPFGTRLNALFCPVCGVVIYAPDKSPSCDHVAFSYLDDIGQFDHVALHLNQVVEEVLGGLDEEAGGESCDRHPVDALMERLNSKSILCLEIATGGMACGPVWSTAHVGIDFCPGGQEQGKGESD